MSYFTELGLAEPLLRALGTKGYGEPTPIQRQSIPSLLEGRDLLGIAQTGTGKTAAFSLPSLHRLAADPKPRRGSSCRMLVLSPTRELAAQIADNIRGYAKYLDINVQCIFGGVPAGKQARALVPGCDILVATPGRLLDLIDQRALTLRDVEIFVLDEADQMMDLGFINPLKRVAAMLPKERQSLFFSATMPLAIAELGKQFIRNPVRAEVTPQATTAERVSQAAIFINQAEKQALLTITLRDGLADKSVDRALVFTRTKHGADRVVRHLVGAGVPAAAIHGNKSQGQRTAAITGFRSGAIPVLVATDIAARGIDIPGVSHVINFEIPHVPEQYVHRIGRTARAGRDGIALSFVAPDERTLIRDVERLTRIKLDPMPLPEGFQAEAAKLPGPAKQAERPEPSRRDGGQGRSGQARGGQRGPGGGQRSRDDRGFGDRGHGGGGRSRDERGPARNRDDRSAAAPARARDDRPARPVQGDRPSAVGLARPRTGDAPRPAHGERSQGERSHSAPARPRSNDGPRPAQGGDRGARNFRGRDRV